MSRNVYVFNAAPVGIYMTVNNGPNRVTVDASNDTSWAPGTPAGASLPVFTGTASGQPGEFHIGDNSVALTPTSGGGVANVSIHVPNSVNPRSDLQLYIFWATTESVSWMLLEDGQPINGTFAID